MAKKSGEDIGFSDLHVQLRIINRLLAAQLRATTGQQEMVRLLSSSGASSAEIADVLDTTPGTVNTTLQRLKKKAGQTAATTSAAVGEQPSGGGEQ